jgi:hypothetical protein
LRRGRRSGECGATSEGLSTLVASRMPRAPSPVVFRCVVKTVSAVRARCIAEGVAADKDA